MIYECICLHHAECSAFDQKWHDPRAPPSLFTQSHPLETFSLFPLMKKVLKKKSFADVEEVKQKMAEARTGIKNDKFQNCFEQWKKTSP